MSGSASAAPVRFRNRAAMLGASIARLPGSRFPVKGWTQVTELIHRRVVREHGEVLHRTQYGVLMCLDLDDYVQRGIFYDAWEVHEINLLRRLLRPRDVMIDVGANVGLFSLVAARAVSESGAVHAFEPVPGNWQKLEENIRLNQISNVRVNRSALSDRAGEVTLAIDANMARTSGPNTSGFFTLSQVEKPVRQVSSPAETLDNYVSRELPGVPIRLVKIDVEGAEPRVLTGMRRTLDSHQVDFLMLEVSVYGLDRSGFRIQDVVGSLQRSGYELYRLGFGGVLTRWAYRGEPSIPRRPERQVGLITGVYQGLQDMARLFNLVAVRDDHSSVAHKPRFILPRNLSPAR
jgi:FkbM family methyltransferase